MMFWFTFEIDSAVNWMNKFTTWKCNWHEAIQIQIFFLLFNPSLQLSWFHPQYLKTRVPGGLLIPVIYLLCVRKHCNRPGAWFNADISIYSQRAVAKQLGSSTEIDVGAVLYGTEHCPYHYTIFCHAQALGQTYDKEWLPLTPLKG